MSAPDNGNPKANPDNGRQANGKFAKGNAGGPGNPYNRRVAELRTQMLEAVTGEDLKDIIRQVIVKARLGDLAAARLVLAYAIGKPTPAPNPDRVEVDEWELAMHNPSMAEMHEGTQEKLPLTMANGFRHAMDVVHTEQLGQEAAKMFLTADDAAAKPKKRDFASAWGMWADDNRVDLPIVNGVNGNGRKGKRKGRGERGA